MVNIVTGSADELARTLATPGEIDAGWRHDGSAAGCAEVERLSAASLKRTWGGGAKGRDWYSTAQAGGRASVIYEGEHIDIAHVKTARDIIALAEQFNS